MTRLHALALAWLFVVVAGLAGMAVHANRPGRPAAAPATWPTSSRLSRDVARPTLVMLVHPQCDCTRASLAELGKLMTHAGARVRAYVVEMRPVGMPTDWDDTGLRRTAASIPGVTVVVDDDGREVERFGAETSGQTLLYSAEGHLLFSGGTTAARGHEGDSAGVAAMLAFIGGDAGAPTSAPVFGCELHDTTTVNAE